MLPQSRDALYALSSSHPAPLTDMMMMERSGWKPNVELSPACPRCGSSNTKFCYYNNYSLTQPRYFCKGCRRYWTKGGSLRNIPVGGGCRKNRRGKSLRLSTDHFMSSRDSNATFRGHPGHFHGSSSSGNPPDIDLALVYANFLNPQHAGSIAVGMSEPQEPVSSSNSAPPSLQHLCLSSGLAGGTDAGIGLLVEAGNGGFFGWESLSDPVFDHPAIVDPLQALHHHGCNEDMNYYALPQLPIDDAVAQAAATDPWQMLDSHGLSTPLEQTQVMEPDHHHQLRAEDPNLSSSTASGVIYRGFDFPGEDTLLPRK
ncbi:hypothetical protein SAY86_023904 [Trapa natans]|uniref:Dof zinc finger protein n=1 Tax=Trapa natans TaxID=22666 RepID=A0AAN7LY55_TRANT|nr:hypothetical protein SAY86_023904 [Trapa natans]